MHRLLNFAEPEKGEGATTTLNVGAEVGMWVHRGGGVMVM
jgi:hypothetical protein